MQIRQVGDASRMGRVVESIVGRSKLVWEGVCGLWCYSASYSFDTLLPEWHAVFGVKELEIV